MNGMRTAREMNTEVPRVGVCRWLYPLAWLYGAGVWLRNKLFDWGCLRSERFDIPVICVGNLAVGGTGKTPHTEYLVRLLVRAGFRPATLSRGYRRHTRGFVLAGEGCDARSIGDEPMQMRLKFPGIRVAVDEDRRRGIRLLSDMDHPKTDVILLDDAFQHRYVRSGLNILLTDYHRLFSEDALMPAGRLREPASGRKRADVVVVTKCPDHMEPDCMAGVAARLRLRPDQRLYFSTLRYGGLYPLYPEGRNVPQEITADTQVLLLTGIASPAALERQLRRSTEQVSVLSYADHHDFAEKDLNHVRERFRRLQARHKLIVTTEKDAARLAGHPGVDGELRPYVSVMPVEVDFLQDKQSFNQNILDYVRTDTRNSRISETENAHPS